MASPPIRIPLVVKQQVEFLAQQCGTTPQIVLARAVEAYTYQWEAERTRAQVAALRQHSERWAALQAERADTGIALSPVGEAVSA